MELCNFIFTDNRPDIFIINKLQFYRSVFPGRLFVLVTNRTDVQLPSDLADVPIVVASPGKTKITGYLVASLFLVPAIADAIVQYCDNGLPNIVLECDLEICRSDIEERVYDILSTRTKSPVGLCCFNSKPPLGEVFAYNGSGVCERHRKTFGFDYPIAATTLGGSVMMYDGAKVIVDWRRKSDVVDYFDFLCNSAEKIESGEIKTCYGVQYFTDYFFPSVCLMSGLSIADPINKVIPRYPHQAGDTVDANSASDVDMMLSDSRFYVIHHISIDKERFPGSIDCLHKVRAKLQGDKYA